MTVAQISEWVDACQATATRKVKEQASLLNGQALQIISGIGSMLDKKQKFVALEKLYPELFGKKAKLKNLTPEQMLQQEVAAWRVFLGT